MSQQEFEPDANMFDPGFTGPGFSTPGHHSWASPEHPGNANPYAPGRWDSPPGIRPAGGVERSGRVRPRTWRLLGNRAYAAPRNAPAQGRLAGTARAARRGGAGPDQRLRHRGHRVPARPRHPAHADRRPRRRSQPVPPQRPVRTLVTPRRAARHHQDRRRTRPSQLLARQQCREPVAIRHPPGEDRGRQQLRDGCRRLPDEPGRRPAQQPVRAVHRRECRLLHPAPASRGVPALVRGPRHLRHPGQPAACDRRGIRPVRSGFQGRRVEERARTVPAVLSQAGAVHRNRLPGLRDPGSSGVRSRAHRLPRADPAADSPVAGWRVSRAEESRKPHRPARPDLLPGQAASRIRPSPTGTAPPAWSSP